MTLMARSWASRSVRLGRVGVLIAVSPAIYRFSEQGQQPVLHIAAGGAFIDIIVGFLCESQSGIKLAACQESSVRGDGRATKIQADSAVDFELQWRVGAFAHWVPPARIRYPDLGLAISPSLAHTLAIMLIYAAQIRSTATGLRRTHAADLGNVGLEKVIRAPARAIRQEVQKLDATAQQFGLIQLPDPPALQQPP